MTELYWISAKEAERLPPEYCEKHFPNRAARARRLLRKEEKILSIGAGALLYGVLGISESEIRTSEHGKPYLPNGKTHFNLSHSGERILLATDDESEIGADIERLNPAHIPLAKEAFSEEEIARTEADACRYFHRIWTLKESVMKQQGLGFALPPKSFSVLPFLRGESILVNGTRLFAATAEYDDYVYAVCAAHELAPLTPKTVTATDLL